MNSYRLKIDNEYVIRLFRSIILFIILLLLITQQIKCQTIPAGNPIELEAIFDQQIIRVSKRLSEQWNISDTFVQHFYYNSGKDNSWPQDQIPKRVLTKYSIPGTNRLQVLELMDDGFHFDKQISDGIYANFLIGNFNDFKTDELIMDVCCYYNSGTEDSIGIEYVSILPAVKYVPLSPKIISPIHRSKVNTTKAVFQWILDEKADGCGLILFSQKPKLGEEFTDIIYEKIFNQGESGIFREEIPVPLTHNTEYHILIWSYINTQFTNGEWNRASYSLEWSSFLVDTTQQLTTSFDLRQNFPNPFSSQTIISWDQQTEVHLSLTIYNALGEEVKNLVNRTMPGGRNFCTWNGMDDQDRRVTSGIYILLAKTPHTTESIKIIYYK